MKRIFLLVTTLLIFSCANSKEVVNSQTHIKNHRFYPAIIKIKENQVLKLTVYNEDSTIEEFESFDLKREKIVPGNNKIIVTMGPLKKGAYEFFGEFHMDTAKGKIIVE